MLGYRLIHPVIPPYGRPLGEYPATETSSSVAGALAPFGLPGQSGAWVGVGGIFYNTVYYAYRPANTRL